MRVTGELSTAEAAVTQLHAGVMSFTPRCDAALGATGPNAINVSRRAVLNDGIDIYAWNICVVNLALNICILYTARSQTAHRASNSCIVRVR